MRTYVRFVQRGCMKNDLHSVDDFTKLIAVSDIDHVRRERRRQHVDPDDVVRRIS